MVLCGGRVWFYWGACVVLCRGGMHGFMRGACVVLCGGACMLLFRGACVVLFGGACMVFSVFLDTMRYGQLAGGTHPTGMHSCFIVFLQPAVSV